MLCEVLNLSGDLEYADYNTIEKWFQTLIMRVKRFHNTWTSGPASAARWLAAVVYYYNVQRPNQAPDNRTSIEEVLDR